MAKLKHPLHRCVAWSYRSRGGAATFLLGHGGLIHRQPLLHRHRLGLLVLRSGGPLLRTSWPGSTFAACSYKHTDIGVNCVVQTRVNYLIVKFLHLHRSTGSFHLLITSSVISGGCDNACHLVIGLKGQFKRGFRNTLSQRNRFLFFNYLFQTELYS